MANMIALAIRDPTTKMYSSFHGTVGLLKSTRPNNLNAHCHPFVVIMTKAGAMSVTVKPQPTWGG